MPRPPLPPVKIRSDQVAAHRERAGYATNTALADAMGVDPSTVGRILTGRTEPSSRFVFELARLLGAKPSDLFTQA